jgi:hypothetical protein
MQEYTPHSPLPATEIPSPPPNIQLTREENENWQGAPFLSHLPL